VLAFARFAEAVSLDGLSENDGRLADVIYGSAEGRVHFDWIVPSQSHACQLIVGQVLNHLQQARIGSEQVLAEIGSAFDEILLVLTVANLAQTLDQQAVAVVLNEAVPIGTPDALDDVPARSAENSFQFLNDFSVAAHRAIEPLQVA